MNSPIDPLAPYDYAFPAELIAQSPADPRDSARLLVYDRKNNATSFSTFADITDFLPKNAVLVFNRTKVFPARMKLKKHTGGGVEALYINEHDRLLRVMASGSFQAGDTLTWEDGHSFTVEARDGKYADLKPSFPLSDLHALLEKFGETPLPPYIKQSPLTEERRRTEYQTVFAEQTGSVAAPTAGLHFTPELLEKIKAHGCDIAYVTLHVNLGTFAPVTDEHLAKKQLHEEWYEINKETAAFLNKAKAEGRPIIAVGTTSVRTLESAVQSSNIVRTGRRPVPTLERLHGVTTIFITENDELQFVDGLITNFHVPRSSLLMLVSALTGRETLLDVYRQAMEKKFRLFSFGDGMLIL